MAQLVDRQTALFKNGLFLIGWDVSSHCVVPNRTNRQFGSVPGCANQNRELSLLFTAQHIVLNKDNRAFFARYLVRLTNIFESVTTLLAR